MAVETTSVQTAEVLAVFTVAAILVLQVRPLQSFANACSTWPVPSQYALSALKHATERHIHLQQMLE
jgi:hypothetical protein